MAPYNDYTAILTSAKIASYHTPSKSYSSTVTSPASYRYKPPLYSSTTSARYRSSTYTPSSSYVPSSSTSSSSYLPSSNSSASSYVPSSITSPSSSYAPSSTSSYTYRTRTPVISANRYATLPATDVSRRVSSVGDYSWRSPSLSRRSSSASLASLDLNDTSDVLEKTPTYTPKLWSNSSTRNTDENKNLRIGLNNLGNTCFMNAVLQCLCHTQPLVDYCTRESYVSDINHRSPTRGNLMKVFADFVKNVVNGNSKSSISPHQLRGEVQRYAPRFSGDNQQDAQEFLRYLLQGLHDDINKGRQRSSYGDASGSDSTTWKKYRETDDSLIVDLFAGQLKSTLKCTECSKDSITYDPFWDISLPMPEGYSRSASLRQCFNLFSSPEILDGPNKPFCESCKKKCRSSKKIEVHKFPKVLVIHLKRFSTACYGQKLTMMVDCPLVLGNISEFGSSNCSGGGYAYSLYGVVDHNGTNNSGHYIAKCRNPISKEWNEFNDSRVTKTAGNIVSSRSYILFYIQE